MDNTQGNTVPIIVQINVSDGGVPKRPVPQAKIQADGVVGESQGKMLRDRQKNLKYHGGPDRAVCLWSSEIIQALQAEGHPIEPGSTGENLTLSGLDWATLEPGVQLQLGANVLLEITDYAQPCRTIARSFKLRRYGRISQKRNPGQSRLYAKVLSPGSLKVGDRISILQGSSPDG